MSGENEKSGGFGRFVKKVTGTTIVIGALWFGIQSAGFESRSSGKSIEGRVLETAILDGPVWRSGKVAQVGALDTGAGYTIFMTQEGYSEDLDGQRVRIDERERGFFNAPAWYEVQVRGDDGKLVPSYDQLQKIGLGSHDIPNILNEPAGSGNVNLYKAGEIHFLDSQDYE